MMFLGGYFFALTFVSLQGVYFKRASALCAVIHMFQYNVGNDVKFIISKNKLTNPLKEIIIDK